MYSLGWAFYPDPRTRPGTDPKIQVRVWNRNREFYPIGSTDGGPVSNRFGSRTDPGPDRVFLEPKILELMSLETRCTYPLVLYTFPVSLVYRFHFPKKTIEKRKLGFTTHKYENQANNKLNKRIQCFSSIRNVQTSIPGLTWCVIAYNYMFIVLVFTWSWCVVCCSSLFLLFVVQNFVLFIFFCSEFVYVFCSSSPCCSTLTWSWIDYVVTIVLVVPCFIIKLLCSSTLTWLLQVWLAFCCRD